MPTALTIEKQVFTFGEKWTIIFKYDDTNFYRNGPALATGTLEGVGQGTKAVDAVGLHESSGLLLLEVKDFRGYRIENKKRITDKEIAVEVALKVRDTVAGLVGAARRGCDEFEAATIKSALNRGKPLLVVLWLENDTAVDLLRWKQQLDILKEELKAKLRWLEGKFLVTSHRTLTRLEGLTVADQPGAGRI